MNLQLLNFALQFARSLFSIAAVCVSEDHFLRQTNPRFGIIHVDALLLPTFLVPMFILFHFGLDTLQAAMQDQRASDWMRKENDRRALSCGAKKKADSSHVILGDGIDQLQRKAISNIVIGSCLLVIGGVFAVLSFHLIVPVDVLYPVTLLLTAVFLINVASLDIFLMSLHSYRSVGIFQLHWQRKVQDIQLRGEAHRKKKVNTVSPSEMLLILFDSGFSGNMYGGLVLLDETLAGLTSSPGNSTPEQQRQVVAEEQAKLSKSLCTVCGTIMRSPENMISTRLEELQRKHGVELCWQAASLALNSVACFSSFAFPILTLAPWSDSRLIARVIHIGNLVGNAAWMIEPIIFVVYKWAEVDFNQGHQHAARKKNL